MQSTTKHGIEEMMMMMMMVKMKTCRALSIQVKAMLKCSLVEETQQKLD